MRFGRKIGKIRKRWLACLTGLIYLFLCLVPCAADVVWEAYDDDFYRSHREECVLWERNYLTNGKEGFAAVMDSPKANQVNAYIENGRKLFVGCTYEDGDGVLWGVVEYFWTEDGEIADSYEEGGEFRNGWVLMEDMALIYDWISFDEDYGSRFCSYGGELDGFEPEEDVVFWDYPGGHPMEQRIGTEMFSEEYGNQIGDSISDIFEDEDGLIWGKITYFYGWRNCWICVSSPYADDLEPRTVEETTLYDSQTPPAAGGTGSAVSGLLIAGLVAAVVVLTLTVYLMLGKLFGKTQAVPAKKKMPSGTKEQYGFQLFSKVWKR